MFQRSLFDERIICDYLFDKDKIYAYQILTDDELIDYENHSEFSPKEFPNQTWRSLQISLPTLLKRIAREGTDFEKTSLKPI